MTKEGNCNWRFVSRHAAMACAVTSRIALSVDCTSTTAVEGIPVASIDNVPSSGTCVGVIKPSSSANQRRPMAILILLSEPDSSLDGTSFKTTAANREDPTSTPPKWGREPHTTSSPSNRPLSEDPSPSVAATARWRCSLVGAIRANPANRCRAQAVLFVAFETTKGKQGFLISF